MSYTLNVGIKPDAPAGPLRDEIRLLSNDREAASIPVMVTGFVRGNLTAAPSVLSLGEVPPRPASKAGSSSAARGRSASRRSKGPATDSRCTAGRRGRKTQHLVTLTYKPEEGTTRGDLRRSFRVHTDLPDEPPLDLTATLHVAP